MPQPYRGRGHIHIHPDVLLHRPRIAALVAETFNAFSRADAHLANVFAATLRAEEEIALDLFLAIESEGPRHAVFDALLRRRLGETQYSRLSSLRGQRKTLIGWRNDFAHNVWALADDSSSDEILLIAQKDYIRWHRAISLVREAADRTKIEVRAMVYAEKEIGEHHDVVHDLSRDISLFAKELIIARASRAETSESSPSSNG